MSHTRRLQLIQPGEQSQAAEDRAQPTSSGRWRGAQRKESPRMNRLYSDAFISANLPYVADHNPNSAPEACRVFISYSWDSEAHKNWVLRFAKRLREDGIDVILDQTHLKLGDRTPHFMEQSATGSRYILVVCTERYKAKFDAREGGAGYEANIISSELINQM